MIYVVGAQKNCLNETGLFDNQFAILHSKIVFTCVFHFAGKFIYFYLSIHF